MIKYCVVFLLLFSCESEESIFCDLKAARYNPNSEQLSQLSPIPPFPPKKMPSFQSDYVLYGSLLINNQKNRVFFSIEFSKDGYFFTIDENLNQSLADEETKIFTKKNQVESKLRLANLFLEFRSEIIFKAKQEFELKTLFKNKRIGNLPASFFDYRLSIIDQNLDARFNSEGDLLLMERTISSSQTIQLSPKKRIKTHLFNDIYEIQLDSLGKRLRFVQSEK